MSQVQSLDDEVRGLVAVILEVDPAQIDGEAKLVEDLGMDSMMALELVASIEKKFKVKLPESVLPTVKTLNSVIELAKQYAH